jgi:hypothetical protein
MVGVIATRAEMMLMTHHTRLLGRHGATARPAHAPLCWCVGCLHGHVYALADVTNFLPLIP